MPILSKVIIDECFCTFMALRISLCSRCQIKARVALKIPGQPILILCQKLNADLVVLDKTQSYGADDTYIGLDALALDLRFDGFAKWLDLGSKNKKLLVLAPAPNVFVEESTTKSRV